MTLTDIRTIDDVLLAARRRLQRLTPAESVAAVHAGAVIIDTRPQANRASEGMVPGSVVIERNILEWRLDPASTYRIEIADYDLHAIVMCNEGYSSTLAAAALQDLGVHRATDMIGGFRAWRAAGLPVTSDPRDVEIVP